MAINFDAIPQQRDGAGTFDLPAPGFHHATIEDAVVKPGDKGDFIQLTLKLANNSKVWDNIFPNSQNANILYKVGRLVRACKLPLSGNIELPDFANLLKGRKLVVDIHIKPNTYNGVTKDKAEVNMFGNDIFYTPEEYAGLVGTQPANEAAAPTPLGTGTPNNNNEY